MMVQKTSDQSLEDLPNHSGSSKDHSGPRSLTTGTKNKHNIEVTYSKLEDFCSNLWSNMDENTHGYSVREEKKVGIKSQWRHCDRNSELQS